MIEEFKKSMKVTHLEIESIKELTDINLEAKFEEYCRSPWLVSYELLVTFDFRIRFECDYEKIFDLRFELWDKDSNNYHSIDLSHFTKVQQIVNLVNSFIGI